MVNLGNTGSLSLGLVMAALIGAAVLDLRSRKIPNAYNVSVFFLALAASLAFNHVGGLWLSLSGIAAALAVGWPAYLTKTFAGGDFKLVLAVSPLLDWRMSIGLVLLSFFWGAIIGLVRTIIDGQFRALVLNMTQLAQRKPLAQQQLHKMPYTVALLFGFMSVITLTKIGWEWL